MEQISSVESTDLDLGGTRKSPAERGGASSPSEISMKKKHEVHEVTQVILRINTVAGMAMLYWW